MKPSHPRLARTTALCLGLACAHVAIAPHAAERAAGEVPGTQLAARARDEALRLYVNAHLAALAGGFLGPARRPDAITTTPRPAAASRDQH